MFPPNSSYALYFVVVATLICHLWSASLSIKLRNFDITNLAGFKKQFEMAGTVAKAGLITEVIMVCLVSLSTRREAVSSYLNLVMNAY